MNNPVETGVAVEILADKLELDLARLELCWSELGYDDRAAVIQRIYSTAPGVARLLCPQLGRFMPATSAQQSGRVATGGS